MATEKPFKKSNFTSFNRQKMEDYIRDLDSDVRSIALYLNTFPKVYLQGTQPTIASDSVAFWKDTDDSKYYLILDIAGTAKKVELT